MNQETLVTFFLSLLFACGGAAETPQPDAEATEAHAKDGEAGHDEHGEHGEHGDHDGDAMEMAKPTEGAKVMFLSPADGAKVKSPVKIEMGIEGMAIKPAGDLEEGTGHHHLIIDSDPVPFGEAVPADEKHIHFGKGQTEAEVELEPGEHVIQMQLADGAHRSYGEQMTAKITVTVEE